MSGEYISLKLNEKINRPIREIVFQLDENIWVMKFTANGILFNREIYPDAQPDDFAQSVIEILEKEFTVKFGRKEPPYDRNLSEES